jgi:hypothetical protein
MTTTVRQEPDVRQSRRESRWAARRVVQDLITSDKLSAHQKRARECGRVCCSPDGVTVRVSTDVAGVRSAGFGGLSSCASVWACPVCSATIANARQVEIQGAVSEWTRRGGRVIFMTATMRHRKGQGLAFLWDSLTDAKHSMLSGRGWQNEQRTWGQPFPRTILSGKRKGEVVWDSRIPSISLVEVTYGEEGWHVHLHALLFVSGRTDPAAVDLLKASMFARWKASLAKKGLTPSDKYGMEAHLVDGRNAAEKLGRYFAKNEYVPVSEADIRAASMEVARGDMKNGKYGNRTPFGILAGLVLVTSSGALDGLTAEDVIRDEAIWHEWERESTGRRQIAWTVGLREYLARALPAEASDQEIVDAAPGGDVVISIDSTTWGIIFRRRAACAVLRAFECSTLAGVDAVAAFGGEGGFRRRPRERVT